MNPRSIACGRDPTNSESGRHGTKCSHKRLRTLRVGEHARRCPATLALRVGVPSTPVLLVGARCIMHVQRMIAPPLSPLGRLKRGDEDRTPFTRLPCQPGKGRPLPSRLVAYHAFV